MTFINERISPQDIDAYSIAEVDARIPGSSVFREWCIDRQRRIYLRKVKAGREECRHESTWNFLWRGKLLTLRLDLVDSSVHRGGAGWAHWRLMHVDGEFGLPDDVPQLQPALVADLKEALLAYKDGGIYATNTEFEVTLSFSPASAVSLP